VTPTGDGTTARTVAGKGYDVGDGYREVWAVYEGTGFHDSGIQAAITIQVDGPALPQGVPERPAVILVQRDGQADPDRYVVIPNQKTLIPVRLGEHIEMRVDHSNDPPPWSGGYARSTELMVSPTAERYNRPEAHDIDGTSADLHGNRDELSWTVHQEYVPTWEEIVTSWRAPLP
jgi:hypothetical protein